MNYSTKLPPLTVAAGGTGMEGLAALAGGYGRLRLLSGPGQYYWVCLRRPANLFAPVSLNNPMVVVDSMRFPMVDATICGRRPVAGQRFNRGKVARR